MDVRNLPLTDVYRKLRDFFYYSRVTNKLNKSKSGFYYFGPEFMNPEDDLTTIDVLIESKEVFIDVGANIGYYALYAQQKGLDIIAFEPDKRNFNILKKNIKAGDKQMEIHNIALGEEPGVLKIFGGGQGASLLKGWANITNNYSDDCRVDTLDNVLGNKYRNKNIFLKIDTEGYEFPVLKGANKFLQSDNNITLYIEHGFTENFGGKVNPNFTTLFEYMFSLGYYAFIDGGRQHTVTMNDVKEWVSNNHRPHDSLNYIFTQEPARNGVK